MPSLARTPLGHLLLNGADDASQPPAALKRKLERAFARGSGHGLLDLGAGEVGTALPADFTRDHDAPFAFLATYTTQLSKQAQAQHLPLGRALSEYAGAANKPRLLSLPLPVQRAAAECPWLKTMVDAGEIYHPLRWTPAEAFHGDVAHWTLDLPCTTSRASRFES
jgi:hypothetical protein